MGYLDSCLLDPIHSHVLEDSGRTSLSDWKVSERGANDLPSWDKVASERNLFGLPCYAADRICLARSKE